MMVVKFFERIQSRKFRDRFFLKTRRAKGWVLVVGEGIAVLAASLSLIPEFPTTFSDKAVPVAVVVGAGALLLVGLSDALDSTHPPIIVIEDLENTPVPPDGTIELVLESLPESTSPVERQS